LALPRFEVELPLALPAVPGIDEPVPGEVTELLPVLDPALPPAVPVPPAEPAAPPAPPAPARTTTRAASLRQCCRSAYQHQDDGSRQKPARIIVRCMTFSLTFD
jgi:hypothetical protein